MTTKKKTIFRSGLILLCLCGVFSMSVRAESYDSYIYINNNSGIYDAPSATAYVAVDMLDSDKLGVTLSTPEDICTDAQGNIYVLNNAAGTIISFTPDWQRRWTIFGYLEPGQTMPTALNDAHGICIQGQTLYVAETGNHRLLKYSIETRELLGEILLGESDLLGDSFEFLPQKVAVDRTGRIFVAAKNVSEGLMELTQTGEFVGFVGSNEVVGNVWEQFLRLFLTEEQIRGRLSFVPVECSNLSLDASGFIYAVTAVSNVSDPIRRLNPSGDDVLVRNPVNGVGTVNGDLLYSNTANVSGPSSFVDIATNDQGVYFALDGKRSRVFAYDESGNMLFEFGGNNNNQVGTLMTPSALVVIDNTIYVLDSGRSAIVRYEPTAYALALMEASRSYIQGDYETSYMQWQALLKENCNFDLAYVKAGFCLYRQGKYKQAMDYFKMGNSREYYTDAFLKYRTETLADNFLFVVLGLVGLAVAITVLQVVFHRRRLALEAAGTARAPSFFKRHAVFRTMIHPLDSFWEMKFGGKGNAGVACLLILAFFLTVLLQRQMRSFSFNTQYNTPLDMWYQIRIVFIPIILFCVGNWAVTSLMDGKGHMKDIFIVTAYALVPLILTKLIGIPLSHFLSLDEAFYMLAVDYIGYIWCGILLFAGISTIHQYSFAKVLLTFLLTLIAALIVVFICLLFASLFQELYGFAYSIYRELSLRM